MRYTTLGKTGLSVSSLGFGCMRLPMKDGRVDRTLSTPMLQKAVELGVNFFDTAIGYCDSDSQAAVGEALESVRSKVVISTKNHLHSADTKTWRAQLENSLRFLRTDYIDLYHHHGIQWNTFVNYLDPAKGGLTAQMIKAKEEGLIRHFGFSFHDTAENLIKLIDTGLYENVILQYNLLDQTNGDAITYAREKGMGVVVMGPVGGGRLGLPNETILELTQGAAASTPEAALRFVWGHGGVNVALSGMQTMEMLNQNVHLAETAEPFTAEQIDTLNRLVVERKEKSGLYCSGCRYCTPECAAGIDIPGQLDLLNNAYIYGLKDDGAAAYRRTKVKARECINCGVCLKKCPQNIDIPAKLREAALLFDEKIGSILVESAIRALRPDGTFSLALEVHNFGNTVRDIAITLSAVDTVTLDRTKIEFDQVDPFARKRVRVGGTVAPSTNSLGLTFDVVSGEQHETVVKKACFEFLRREWSPWFIRDAVESDFSNNPETANLHGIRFRVAYNDTGIKLETLVRDDFLVPSRRQDHKGLLVDGLELYLDGRKPTRLGHPSYEKGVFQIMLYPGNPGTNPPFYHLNGACKLSVESSRTVDGYALNAHIPFASFCVSDGIPEKIGFDLGMNTADANGNRIGQLIWAGADDNWDNAANFREFWLV